MARGTVYRDGQPSLLIHHARQDSLVLSLLFLPPPPSQLDDSAVALTGSYFSNGEYQYFCNRRFTELFMSAEELTCRSKSLKLIPLFALIRWGGREGGGGDSS